MTGTSQQSKLRSWFWATRPFSLSASVAPVLVGSVFAASLKSMDWLLFALVLSGSMAIQIGTNLTDEYSDHHNSGGSGKFLAPHKVIQRGFLSERAVLAGMTVAFGYAVVAGLIIVALTGWPILAIGVMSVAAAFFYSGGPYPLGNLGLGEPVVFLFMGPLTVMGAFYAQVETFTWGSFWVSLPVAFTVTAILHCNNLRDVDEDHEVGKRSIAMALGPTPSRWLYAGLLAAAYGTLALLAATDVISPWGLAGLLPTPWAVGSVRMLFAADNRPAMNRVMVRSAKIHGWTGVTLAAGLLYATL